MAVLRRMYVAQHATFTFCGIEMASYMGLFPRKTVPRIKVTPLAFAFVAFVVSGGSPYQIPSGNENENIALMVTLSDTSHLAVPDQSES